MGKLTTRQRRILNLLTQGNSISRHWSGSKRGGHVSHQLAGIPRLREAECEALQQSGYIAVRQERVRVLHFAPLEITEAGRKALEE